MSELGSFWFSSLLEVFFINGLLFEMKYYITGNEVQLIDKELVDRFSHVLRPLGLSEYEVRVFLTLVIGGPANYRVISRQSDVPTGKIYQVLSALEARGFVEVIQEKPKIWRAVEPKKALRRRLKQLEEDAFELEHKIRDVLPTLQLRYGLKHDIIQGVVSEILVNSNSFSKSIQETLLRASDEVLIVTPSFDVKLHEEDVFRRLLERGVLIRMICSDVDENSKTILERLLRSGLNVRIQDVLADKYYVVDDNYAFTFVNRSDEDVCLQMQGSPLCRVLKARFEERWKYARNFGSKTHYRGALK